MDFFTFIVIFFFLVILIIFYQLLSRGLTFTSVK